MLILGLNAYHGDSAACLLDDGRLIAAAEEERFRRVKHWGGLPIQAIQYCLDEAGASLGDIDHIAINRKPGANNWRRLCFMVRQRPDVALVRNRIGNIRAALSLREKLDQSFTGQTCPARVHYIEHHLAHLASGYFISGLRRAACVSVDGFGDFASTAWGFAHDASMSIDGRIYFPHSLGIFYSAITQYLGFLNFGDEYKVIGLAAYGEPRYLRRMRRILRVHPEGTFELDLKYFRHYRDDVSYSWNECAPSVGTLYTPELVQLLGPPRQTSDPIEPRHHDLAHSAQNIYEEALFALLNAVYRKYRNPHLVLAGGCAMNSVANGKICLRTPFKEVFVPPAPGDAGGAIGAALVVSRKLLTKAGDSKFFLPSAPSDPFPAYTGPQFADSSIEDLLIRRGLLPRKCKNATKQSVLNPQTLKPAAA